MQFKQVIGQDETKRHLIQMFRQKRLSHALLFLGKEGTGGLSLARAFIQYLVCEKVNGTERKAENNAPSLFGVPAEEMPSAFDAAEDDSPEDSCGVCPACIKSSGLIHPDIHYSYPVVSSKKFEKPVSTDYITEWREFVEAQPYGNTYDWLQFIAAENKQGKISASECNEISRKLSLKSFESEYKFLILWMPELLGQEGNKLLKLIEEPPPHTIILLVTENERLVLPTILSRTQLIKLSPLQTDEIATALSSREGISAEVADNIALSSDGNYHEALLQIQHTGDNWEQLLRDWLNIIVKRSMASQVAWVEELSKLGREKQKQFLKYFSQMIEIAVKMRYTETGHSSSNAVERYAHMVDFAVRFNKICDISQQEAIIKEIDLATYYIERNANIKILFLSLSIRLFHIISNKSVILVN